jgi:ferrous iron transport protein B
MSCSARLPVYLLLAGAFFPKQAGLVLFCLYLGGILVAVCSARLFKRWLIKGKDLPFVMELPPYRIPTLRSVMRHMWDKSNQYLRKIGTVIMVASVIIWFLGYFPRAEGMASAGSGSTEKAQTVTASSTLEPVNEAIQLQQSYIGQLGQWLEPVVRPLGFDWKTAVALLTGVAAKEVVVSTLSVMYAGEEPTASLSDRLQAATYPDSKPVFNQAVALALMVFVLLYIPCMATVRAIQYETGSWKWALFEVVYTIAVAWFMAFVVYRICLFGW